MTVEGYTKPRAGTVRRKMSESDRKKKIDDGERSRSILLQRVVTYVPWHRPRAEIDRTYELFPPKPKIVSQVEGNYTDGQRHGLWTEWHENGKKKS